MNIVWMKCVILCNIWTIMIMIIGYVISIHFPFFSYPNLSWYTWVVIRSYSMIHIHSFIERRTKEMSKSMMWLLELLPKLDQIGLNAIRLIVEWHVRFDKINYNGTWLNHPIPLPTLLLDTINKWPRWLMNRSNWSGTFFFAIDQAMGTRKR